jgi:hypothetical protein
MEVFIVGVKQDRKPIEAITVKDFTMCSVSAVRELEAYTTELEKQIEAMKCCNNCNRLKPFIRARCVNCFRFYVNKPKDKEDNWQMRNQP